MQASKLNPTYLDGPLNTRGDEKSAELIATIAEKAASSLAEINVLEVGPGGGVVLEGVANAHLPNDTLARLNIVTLELFPSASSRLEKACEALQERGASINPIIGNMATMPFKATSFDIVAASAVLHEVYSYEDGPRSIQQALSETARVLKPGGVFLYRDIFGVEDNLHDPFEQHYIEPSWCHFAKRFLPHFIDTANHPYATSDIDVRTNSDGSIFLHCPKGLARDIQRHYITFRDHIWRTRAVGVWPTDESLQETVWLDEATLIKQVYFEKADNIDPSSIPSASTARGQYADGVTFDRYTDYLIGLGFEQSTEEAPSSVEREFTNWLKREGSEVYVYATPNELISMAHDAHASIPLTAYPSEVEIYPRSYYSGYLHRTLGQDALVDAKLAVQFRRLN